MTPLDDLSGEDLAVCRDGMKDKLSREENEQQRREHEQEMRRILWAVGPIAFLFVLLWLFHHY
jgi:hypothetical protein